ncbi:hypothetical protein CJF42_03480 [Pseudoalteromonas sp. NBT06-2]|uniref:hybrid non-ribosomal peptide synthetase/type I polyketide synthase n=1 Tax=Pseudoalteromonas sp. NBT06-2 TaxID=2025950 RepID=UPI000BA725FD|nr:hybrid non-ribosomal peptide synthetase/type I polyketide synthase [Pseudoalteromonas sp. NBT06-2]PAJ75705.1 hypothetical protein CJF42_03480 [Pseudoalteromonas sp. NBT06-2]
MIINELLLACKENGILLHLNGDKLKVDAPEGAMSVEIMEQLKHHKSELIELLIDLQVPKNTPLVKVPDDQNVQVTFEQRGLWYIDKLTENNSAYNMTAGLKLTGKLNLTALQQALTEIIHRHESLRTVVVEQEGDLVLKVNPSTEYKLDKIDHTSYQEDSEKQQAAINANIEVFSNKTFDLAHDLMFRAEIIVTSPDEHILLVAIHHIAGDGWSVSILIEELSKLYAWFSQEQVPALPPLLFQYRDYAYWRNTMFNTESKQEHLNYWSNRLSGLPDNHSLPFDFQRPDVPNYDAGNVNQIIDESDTAKIAEYCRINKVTLFMFLQSVYALLVSKFSYEDEVILGSPMANRTQTELESLIGLFTNSMVSRTHIKQEESFNELVTRVKHESLADLKFASLPFELLVEHLKPHRSYNKNPLFQLGLVLENNTKAELVLDDLRIQQLEVAANKAKFDLMLSAEEGEQLKLNWSYQTELFEHDTIQTMSRCFSNLVSQVLSMPEQKISAMSLLGGSVFSLHAVSQKPLTASNHGHLLHKLSEQLVENPDDIAMSLGDKELTFAELCFESDLLAKKLIEFGVKEHDLVGVCSEQNIQLLINIWAIWKAGAAYVPMEPSLPSSRLAFIAQEAKLKLILVDDTAPDVFDDISSAIDPVNLNLTNNNVDLPIVIEEQRAYVIFTSGSTGQPKGVEVCHSNILAFTEGFLKQVNSLDRDNSKSWLWNASFTFDVSLKGVILQANGFHLHVVTPEQKKNAVALVDYASQHQLPIINCTPGMMSLVLDELETTSYLPNLIVDGDRVSHTLWDRFVAYQNRTERVVINAYGPTEATVNGSYSIVKDKEYNNIGPMMDNYSGYVADKGGNILPIGAKGELYIGGSGVAKGYLNQPELTAQKFGISSTELLPNIPMYRSGDLVRMLKGESIEFYTRIDSQVKVRGFRIELGEIEACLNEGKYYQTLAVVAKASSSGDNILAAYFTLKDSGGDAESAIDEFKLLVEELPDYMRPQHYCVLDKLPLNPAGKLDKARLPAPVEHYLQDTPYCEPKNDMESWLVEVFEELLNLSKVSVTANFFELGGHSLIAIKVISRIKAKLGVNLPIFDFLSNPTARQVAKVLSEKVESENSMSSSKLPEITKVAKGSTFPVSSSQRRLWITEHLSDEPANYNITATLRLTGKLNKGFVDSAFSQIIERHEILRTTYHDKSNIVYQTVQAFSPFQCQQENWTHLNAEQILENSRAILQASFDLTGEWPFKVTLATVNTDEYLLMVNMHHIASDGWSVGVIIEEFVAYYCAAIDKKQRTVAELPIQYKDYAHWQNENLQSDAIKDREAYWQKQLDGIPTAHNLPLSFQRPMQQTFVGANYRSSLSLTLLNDLNSLVNEHASTLFILMETAFSLLVGRWSNATDVVIGTPIANRQQLELEKLIGFFVNVLPLRSTLDDAMTFAELLKNNQRSITDAFDNQQVPFERIVEIAEPARHSDHAPVVQLMFTLQNNENTTIELPEISVEILEEDNRTAKFELGLTVNVLPSGMELDWEYNSSLFNEEFIARFADSFECLLKDVVGQPELPLFDYSILPVADKAQLEEWNNTDKTYDKELTLVAAFERQVALNPEKRALVFESEALTFGQLNNRANQLARLLIDQRPQGSDIYVGICHVRSIEMIVSILAVIKAGLAYVPIDPEVPQSRIDYILDDGKITLLLTSKLVNDSFSFENVTCILVDETNTKKLLDNQIVENLPHIITSKDPAYVIYTSGSTGKPKGVVVEHQSIINFLTEIGGRLGWQAPVNFSSWTNYVFDLSLCEIFIPLLSGGELHMLSESIRLEPEKVFAVLKENQITATSFPPFFITPLLIFLKEYGHSLDLKQLIFGLEPIAEEQLQQMMELVPGLQVINGYGPTEATVGCTFYGVPKTKKVSRNANTPVGKAIQNSRLFVLNEAAQPAPIGVPGELYIGGDCLARGYLNKPELTKQGFVDACYINGESRLYRTGDWVKYLPDGNIEFVGRKDNQIKISGLRIELGEVESKISSCVGVDQVVVVARSLNSNLKDKKLLAVVVPSDISVLTQRDEFISSLRKQLHQLMPSYMVPSKIIVESTLPYTATDKVDRKKIMEMEIVTELQQSRSILPSNKLEQQVKVHWENVLGLQGIGIDDSFFELGGTSLNVVALVKLINQAFDSKIRAVDVFSQPTIRAMAALLNNVEISPEKKKRERSVFATNDIAIVGMSGRFSDAPTLDQFWSNLVEGKEGIHNFSEQELLETGVSSEALLNPNYVRRKGILSDSYKFDNNMFGYAAHEADLMDPQLRVLHECVWDVFENAGYVAGNYEGKVGIYGGASNNLHWMKHLLSLEDLDDSQLYDSATLSDREFFLTRIANNLNLNGPAINVQSACSTSLVAVHMAVQGLLSGDCDMAVAGGVSIQAKKDGYFYQEGMINSPDGHCRPFDAEAKGTVGGEGVGAVLLKRLEDAEQDGDQILAVIKGTAINNDGNQKVGFTAPSVQGQQEVIRNALEKANISPEKVSYIECHGTGTPLGDPIEIEALNLAFGDLGEQNCKLGALKSNLGHLDAAAGIAGLIKTVLCLKHEQIPPTLHYKNSNPNINFEDSPFQVNSDLHEWKASSAPLHAGVSSFGIGGTNAHVVLEQYKDKRKTSESRHWQLFPLSAKTSSALANRQQDLVKYLTQFTGQLPDVSYTLQVGREGLSHRQMMLVGPDQNVQDVLAGKYPTQLFLGERQQGDVEATIFMFPGQGSQYGGMIQELYNSEAVFKTHVDECIEILDGLLPESLMPLLMAEKGDLNADERLQNTALTQPALFVTEYALAKQLIIWGVKPTGMIGHSIGEYVAACLANVFSLEDGLKLVVQRGKLMASANPGSMLSVNLHSDELASYLPADVSIAAVNSSDLSVVSGPDSEIDRVMETLAEQGIKHSRLHTSHAYHSEMMRSIIPMFRKVLESIQFNVPSLPYISNVTGDWITAEDVTSIDYWCDHLLGTVAFSRGLDNLLAEPNTTFVEIGPGHNLSNFVRRHKAKLSSHRVINCMRHAREEHSADQQLHQAVANLFVAGLDLDWHSYRANESRIRLGLPGYPFESVTFAPGNSVINESVFVSSSKAKEASLHSRPNLSVPYVAPEGEMQEALAEIWMKLFKISEVGIHDNFFELGGHSLMATTLLSRINERFEIQLKIETVLIKNTIAELSEQIELLLWNYSTSQDGTLAEEEECGSI